MKLAAHWVVRWAWLWIALWPIAAVLAWHGAPRLSTILADDSQDFIPGDMPSRRAFALMRQEFPDSAPASRATLIAARNEGLTDLDRSFLAGIAARLSAQQAEWQWRVRAVSLSPFLRPLSESADGRASLIAVDLPADMLTHSSVKRVRSVQETVRQAGPPPPGLQLEITDSAALGELLDAHAKRDVDRTTLWTFAGVGLGLLAGYRSPLAMLLPIVTTGLSLMVALGLVGRAAAAWLPINGLVEMFIVVILAGAGVDYCLFLFARFAEERQRASEANSSRVTAKQEAFPDPETQAVERAVTLTGAGILGSAATNIAGLATLALARNRDLYTSGPTIAFALIIATLAVLTLAPSLMRILGAALFWPASLRRSPHREGFWWPRVARIVTQRPGSVAFLCLLMLTPFAVRGMFVVPSYDSLDEFPADSSFVRGARLYEEHFHAGLGVSEFTLLVTADRRLDTADILPLLKEGLERYSENTTSRWPAASIRDLNNPLGNQPSGQEPHTNLAEQLAADVTARLAGEYYIGRTGRTSRIDVAIPSPPRTPASMALVGAQNEAVMAAFTVSGVYEAVDGSLSIHVAGDAARYADIRALRTRDFSVVATAATLAIYAVLLVLTRSWLESTVLIGASLLAYAATYGLTFLIVRQLLGLTSLSYQIDFLLFVILISLGQDYNIYVVTRIREELRQHPPKEAIARAIRRTGKVVSGCGIIMAIAFASMYSGSLMLMKQFAIALSLGILIDTFLIRPLLVPALLLLMRRAKSEGISTVTCPQECAASKTNVAAS